MVQLKIICAKYIGREKCLQVQLEATKALKSHFSVAWLNRIENHNEKTIFLYEHH